MAENALAHPSAEVVIVGGGVVGLSIAFHLAEQGVQDVLVLEKDVIASGATSKGSGGIRQQFSTRANVELSLESVRFFERFEERVGFPFRFLQSGYLFLVHDDRQLEHFTKGAAVQNSLGVPTEIITPSEVQARFPMIEVSGLSGASFCRTDGSGSAVDAAFGFARRARELGVRIAERVEVIAIEVMRDRVEAVRTPRHRIATSTLVNAAGPWARKVGEMAGMKLPVTTHPRQVFSLAPLEGLGEEFPFTVDMESGVYIHQKQDLVVLGGGDRDRPRSNEATMDWSRFDSVHFHAARRVPAVTAAERISGWAGLRDMTPDDHAILGPVPHIHGMWWAVGFSGHGFMHAPAVGRIIAEWVSRGATRDVDITAFSHDRFQSSERITEHAVF